MSEFDRARERAEKRRARLGIPDNTEILEAVATSEVRLPEAPIPKAPRKRSNEIAVQVWIDGNEYGFTFKTNITGTILATQHSSKGMQHIILEALRAKFGAVELV